MKIYFLIDINLFAAAILFTVTYYLKKNLPNKTSIVSYLNLTTNLLFVSLMIGALSKYFIYSALPDKTYVKIITHIVIFLSKYLQAIIPFTWTLFLIEYVKKDNSNIKGKLKYLCIPFMIITFICLLTPFTGWVYKLFQDGKVYQTGPLLPLLLLISNLYLIYCLILIIKYRKTLATREKIILFCFSFLPTLGFVCQLLDDELFYTQPFIAISVILTYVYLEENMIRYDNLTNAWNIKAFDKFIDFNFKTGNKEYSLSYIELNEYGEIKENMGQEEADKYVAAFSKIALKHITEKIHLIYLQNNEFLVYFSSTNPKIIIGKILEIEESLNKYNKENPNCPISFKHFEETFIEEKYKTNANLIRYIREQVYQENLRLKKVN